MITSKIPKNKSDKESERSLQEHVETAYKEIKSPKNEELFHTVNRIKLQLVIDYMESP